MSDTLGIVLNIQSCICLFFGRVKENVYVNHTASKTSTRSGTSLSLVVGMVYGRSDEMSLKSIQS